MDPLPLNQVIHGDCIDVMKTFPDNSIDCVVTDPPYGMSFMGKEWDKALPPLAAFTEVCRVLKPGALCFVMSSPRQDLMWRMMKLLEDAGFEVSQSFISWIYKTGFPKAYDVSKGIDSKKKLKRTEYEVDDNFLRRNPVSNHKPDYDGNFNDGLDASKRFKPVSDEARQWDGWKSITGLKPALEPILMVNKPLSEKTIVDNVLKWGTGAMNVDACRIPFENEADIGDKDRFKGLSVLPPEKGWNKNKIICNTEVGSKGGRFPANLLVSDNAIDTGEITIGDNRIETIGRSPNLGSKGIYGKSGVVNSPRYSDVGDQSRYFDLDAWATHHGILDVPKPDNKERDYGLKNKPKEVHRAGHGNKETDDVTQRFRTIARNIHPTVKPIKLMAYLIELGCPRDGVVMDPFVGSGTTCIAAKQLCRRYIGIELSPEYHALAEARIAAYPEPLEWFNAQRHGGS